MKVTAFDKYEQMGAYHWRECDRRFANWRAYNPALDARYRLTLQRIVSLGIKGEALDVGCGDGYLLSLLASTMSRAVGLDTETEAVRLAREQLGSRSNCEVVQTSCYDLPFPDGRFDLVTSADVIEHLTEPQHHLSEIARVLKPDGCLVLTTPKWRPDRKWDLRHEKEYRPEELLKLLEPGFGQVELSFFWPLIWSRRYSTKLGWRGIKWLALLGFNPFMKCNSSRPDDFGQMLLVARNPVATEARGPS